MICERCNIEMTRTAPNLYPNVWYCEKCKWSLVSDDNKIEKIGLEKFIGGDNNE